MNITQHAQQLLQSVSDVCATCRGRPIIFVAHSLGGILVKDALLQSAKYEYQPSLKDISAACSAIIFFGTPHHGTNSAAYGDMIARIVGTLPLFPSVYRPILRELRPDGEKLSNVSADFNDVLNQNVHPSSKIQIYSFQEAKGMFNLSGIDEKVVPDVSSCFNRRDIKQKSFIMKDHSNMCKMESTSDPAFRSFQAALGGYLENLETKQNAQQTSNIVVHPVPPEPVRPQPILPSIPPTASMQQADPFKLIELLDYDERLDRQRHMSDLQTFNETFQWLWSTEFIDWLEGSMTLFWIYGSPASGKSTLMHYLVTNAEARHILEEKLGSNHVLAHHFFSPGGVSSLNSLSTLLRALLIQIIQQVPNVSFSVGELARFVMTLQRNGILPNSKQLSSRLRIQILKVVRSMTYLFLFLFDGLECYNDSKQEIVAFIQDLQTGNQHVKVCIGSRVEPWLRAAFEGDCRFRVQDVNAPSIRTYSRLTLSSLVDGRRVMQQRVLNEIIERIAVLSQGRYLWARFAVLQMAQLLVSTPTSSTETVASKFESMPNNLRGVHSQVISIRARSPARVTSNFDPESFRYLAECVRDLAAAQSDHEGETTSSQEVVRAVAEACSSSEASPITTVVMSEVLRPWLIQIAETRTKMKTHNQCTVEPLENDTRSLREKSVAADRLRSKINVTKQLLRTVPLNEPKLVCTDSSCVEYKDDGMGNLLTHYPHPCLVPCYLMDVQADVLAHPAVRDCDAFRGKDYCRKCGHHWQSHMHIIYELETYTTTVKDETVAEAFKQATKEIDKLQAAKSSREKLCTELSTELQQIEQTAARLNLWIKDNSILPHRDPVLLRDASNTVPYEEVVNKLTEDFKASGMVEFIDRRELRRLIEQLCGLKHFQKFSKT